MSEIQEFETARFYTRSRKFPKVIGRFHDGTRIPGGPYTVAQVVIGGAVAFVAVTTRGAWGTGSILLDLPLSLAIAWGAAWGAGRIPATRRNLLTVILGAFSAAFQPAAGRYRERPLRLNKPHQAAGKAAIALAAPVAPSVAESSTETSPAEITSVEPVKPIPARELEASPAQRTVAVTAVERLLQQSRTK